MISLRKPSNPEEVYRELLSENPDALIVMGFESAYIGMTVSDVYPVSAVYDYDECVYVISRDRQCDDEEAELIVKEEILSQCVFDDSPVFVRTK